VCELAASIDVRRGWRFLQEGFDTKFVVLTSQRSGSTWLIDLLDRLPSATAYGELFLPEVREWDAGSQNYPRFIEWIAGRPAAFRLFSVFAYLNGLYRRQGAVGFKLMYSQLRMFPEILPYLCARRMPVVHLVRRNHLDVVISGALVRATGQAHRQQGEPSKKPARVYLDPSMLLPQLTRLQRNMEVARGLLRWCHIPSIEVAYEDLALNPSSFDRVWDFLGISVQEGLMPESELLKIRRGGYREVIGNYEDVSAALLGSSFEHFLHETERTPSRAEP
jgi:LPS sulfotransferase NodH